MARSKLRKEASLIVVAHGNVTLQRANSKSFSHKHVVINMRSFARACELVPCRLVLLCKRCRTTPEQLVSRCFEANKWNRPL